MNKGIKKDFCLHFFFILVKSFLTKLQTSGQYSYNLIDFDVDQIKNELTNDK